MPDLKKMKVLVIGSGPTTIGNAGECDEGVLDACRTLTAQGCTLVTMDANPDAVFNGAPWSTHTITEPLAPATVKAIIENEKPDALLSLFGGRGGLHLVSELYQNGTLLKNKVSLWGPSRSCIEGVRDRDTLQSALAPIGLKTPSITPVNGVDEAVEKAQELGFPIVLRCDDAQLLPDGLLIYNQDDLNQTGAALSAELSCKLSIEASLLEWQQIELEVLRDRTGQSMVVGAIEYLDTAGVHPGDAIGVSPPQAISHSLASTLSKKAEAIADHLEIIGNATLRFAYLPHRQDLLVLAVHPRYTTSAALVGRITGVPIAKLSTLLAAGFTLDQLTDDLPSPNASAEAATVVGVRWPSWDFSRLKPTQDRLGLQMQATGHHVGYGNNFKEALQNAARAAGRNTGSISSEADKLDQTPLAHLLPRLATPSSRRLAALYAVLRKGAAMDEISRLTHMAPWFIEQLGKMVETERRLKAHQGQRPDEKLISRAATHGFSRIDIARIVDLPIETIDKLMSEAGVVKNWRQIPGLQQRYRAIGSGAALCQPGNGQSVVLLANGAYGIGNGAECDYGIFHAAHTLNNMGYTPIVINSNIASAAYAPSASIICYNAPLTVPEVADITRSEKPIGVIAQFAGTMADALSIEIASMGCHLLGTPIETLALQQNKEEFKERMRHLGIPQPASGNARTPLEATQLAEQIGYPVVVSGKGNGSTEIIQDASALDDLLTDVAAKNFPLWIEQLLEYAIEAQAEVLCDGQDAHVAAVMEHIELAGVHAGDSAAVIPPYSIAPRHMETISAYCHKISTALNVKGLINIRFGIYRDTVYLLETHSNVSRNMAVVSKSLNAPLTQWATRLIMGASISALGIEHITPSPNTQRCGVRAPVFAFNIFSTVDPLLGPNMRSTGQVMAMADSFGMAYFKALESTGMPLPKEGTVLITVTDEDKSSILEPARIFSELGFKILATKGTHKVLADHGITATLVRKLGFGRPNLVDEIKNGNVQMVINTPTGGQGQIDDSVIRKAAIRCRIVNITTPASALAAAKGIAAALQQNG